MSNQKKRWIKVADSVEKLAFPINNIVEVEADEKRICIAKYNNQLFAFSHQCPHAGGFFSGGFIDALGNVVCPLHHYKYCLKNGYNSTAEGYHLKHWPVDVTESGVYVILEENKRFGLL